MSDDPDLKERASAYVTRGKQAKERWDGSTWGRALRRFVLLNGNVLAAGIAYLSLTSIAAGAVIAATVASVSVATNPTLRAAMFDYLGEAVPGLVATDDSPGLIDPDILSSSGTALATGIIGVVTLLILLNTASRYVRGLRTSLRSMLGREVASPVSGRVRDLVALVALVVIAVVGIAIQVVASGAAEWVAELVGMSVPSWVLRASAALAGVIADMLFVALALMLLGGAAWSRRLLWVVLVSALAIGVLRQFISLFVSGVTDNKVLAPFAAIFTLMIFVDYVNRVLLLTAAWLGAHHREPAGVETARPEDAPTMTVDSAVAPNRDTPVTTARATVRDRGAQA